MQNTTHLEIPTNTNRNQIQITNTITDHTTNANITHIHKIRIINTEMQKYNKYTKHRINPQDTPEYQKYPRIHQNTITIP